MFDQKIKTTMSQADALLDAANEELCRPEEDVVPYMVCNNAYKSVGKYLTGYAILTRAAPGSKSPRGIPPDSDGYSCERWPTVCRGCGRWILARLSFHRASHRARQAEDQRAGVSCCFSFREIPDACRRAWWSSSPRDNS